MTTVSIAVCAHESRRAMAESLAAQLECPISMDDGTIGGARNHDETLRLAGGTDADWIIAMEDDALPVPNFHEHAAAALAVSPSPVTSLYFGYVDRPDAGIVERLKPDIHWLSLHALANTVCLAVRRDHLEPLLTEASKYGEMCCDMRYEQAAIKLGITSFAYSNPSLVQHRDGKTVNYTGAPHISRQAYQVGSRPQWGTKTLRLPEDA